MKAKNNTKPALVVTAAALLFTVLLKLVDVQPIGPNGSEVGFAALNGAVADLLGVSVFWYDISQTLGYVAILLGAMFAVIGALQLIRRRSLAKVDPEIIALGALYAVTLILYLLFDKVALNYRPILENGVLEPSYPSSHTLLSLVVFGSAFLLIRRYFYPGRVQKVLTGCDLVFLILTVLARLLSGCHWLTDIVGGMLISAALLGWFSVLKDTLKRVKKR